MNSDVFPKRPKDGWLGPCVDIASQREVIERISRESPPDDNQEKFVVTSPGARTAAWAIKIVSNSAYNVYNVQAVIVGVPGTVPTEIGQQTQATNLAEPFLEQGQLASGTYAVMSRVGDKNVFYAPA